MKILLIFLLSWLRCSLDDASLEALERRRCNNNSECPNAQCVNYHCTFLDPSQDSPDAPREAVCGDGRLDDTEECEEGQFREEHCQSLGFGRGELTCKECKIDTKSCTSCGNQQRDPEEACDGEDLAGATCEDLGLLGAPSLLGCLDDCSLDTSRCLDAKDGNPQQSIPEHFIFVQHGTFSRGSPSDVPQPQRSEDEPLHRVRITRDFIIQRHEVTQEQWSQVYRASPTPSSYYQCGPSCPVETVSFLEVLDYLNKISEREGLAPCYPHLPLGLPFDNPHPILFQGLDCLGYRLPTEAEWEYAAKGGHLGSERENFPYYGSQGGVPNRYYGYCQDERLDPLAWYFNNSVSDCQTTLRCTGDTCGEFTCSCPEDTSDFCNEENVVPITQDCLAPHPVMQKEPNILSLYDMHGNVSEMVWDAYAPYTLEEGRASVDPIASGSELLNARRVIRGGNFANPAALCRASARAHILWPYKIFHTGFRPVRTFP